MNIALVTLDQEIAASSVNGICRPLAMPAVEQREGSVTTSLLPEVIGQDNGILDASINSSFEVIQDEDPEDVRCDGNSLPFEVYVDDTSAEISFLLSFTTVVE